MTCPARSASTPDASNWRRACRDLLKGAKRVAMEYSPGNAIPYVSRVDAGTIEAVRQCGPAVVSSGDLAQRFEAVWTDAALATHLAAAERLYRIKDRAFEMIRQRMAAGATLTEIEVQEAMVEWFREEGLVADTRAERVGAGERRQPALSGHSRRAPDDWSQRRRSDRSLG